RLILAFGLGYGLVGKKRDSVVLYWGQNSYGNYGGMPKWERRLNDTCDDSSVDVVVLAFLHNLRPGYGNLPILNLSMHCSANFPFPDHDILRCPEVEEDIKFCKSKGKTLLLSIGGERANTIIPSHTDAVILANDIWDQYLGGNHLVRPFGSAILDGVDLDLEGGSQDYYDTFLTTLRSKFDTTDNKYYITASPQCVYPDRNLERILDTNYLDALFIQFYNNHCGVQSFEDKRSWNWNLWETWATHTSKNNGIKLFLGIPASSLAASSGYAAPHQIFSILKAIRNSQHFGGVMIWDASQNENNLVRGKSISSHIKDFLTHYSFPSFLTLDIPNPHLKPNLKPNSSSHPTPPPDQQNPLDNMAKSIVTSPYALSPILAFLYVLYYV
ncbi:Chitinase 2, partial [Massospora cicadina]